MHIPTTYALIWYSTSILGSWNSHWTCIYLFRSLLWLHPRDSLACGFQSRNDCAAQMLLWWNYFGRMLWPECQDQSITVKWPGYLDLDRLFIMYIYIHIITIITIIITIITIIYIYTYILLLLLFPSHTPDVPPIRHYAESSTFHGRT